MFQFMPIYCQLDKVTMYLSLKWNFMIACLVAYFLVVFFRVVVLCDGWLRDHMYMKHIIFTLYISNILYYSGKYIVLSYCAIPVLSTHILVIWLQGVLTIENLCYSMRTFIFQNYVKFCLLIDYLLLFSKEILFLQGKILKH